MLYTYRIERVNGVEFVIQEHYRKRLMSQQEIDDFQVFKDNYLEFVSADTYDWDSPDLEKFFCEEIHDHGVYDLNEVSGVEALKTAFRAYKQIPVMELFPCCVVRGAVVNNKVVEIYSSYLDSVLPGEVESDIHRFYCLFDSIHWRNTIAYQRDKQYGNLFEPSGFEETRSK